MSAEELALLICRSLQRSPAVEVDGLGVFTRGSNGRIGFRRANQPRVFIAYAVEDAAFANRLFECLEAWGCAPWLDRRMLMPGQDWPRRIQDAIESSDFFIACFSRTSVSKRGGFQAEVTAGSGLRTEDSFGRCVSDSGSAGRLPGSGADSAGDAVCRFVSGLGGWGRAGSEHYREAAEVSRRDPKNI